MNVLIVEDEWIVSEELKEVLIEQGVKSVLQVDTGKEAIDLITSNKLELAVLDIMLKDEIDGVNVASKLMKHQKNCSIVFISSYYDRAAYQYISWIKPIAIFNKPFAPLSLISVLKNKNILK